jgi:hypothetical protein
VTPVLAAHLVERVRDLPERAALHRLEQLREDVAAACRDLLQPLQRGRCVGRVTCLERARGIDLRLLL